MRPTAKAKPMKAAPIPQGCVPAEFSSTDAAALQAVSTGTADDGQQKRALKWILEAACALPLWAYREDDKETYIALGRQFVGQQIMGLLKVNISQLRQREGRQDSEHG